jgi:hypothetical protein
MAIYNASQAHGATAAAALQRCLPDPIPLESKVRRVCTDNRLHAWEWLVAGDRLIKTDALDHSAAHDLIGHQDVSWDIAGAIVELELSESQASQLCEVVRQESDHPVDQDLLAFMLPCYLAFQIGAHITAAQALGEASEATRLRLAAERYGRLLREHLSLSLRPEPSQEQGQVPAS